MNFINQNSTIFVSDISCGFSHYFASLLQDRIFPPLKETEEKLRAAKVSPDFIGKKPCYILENDTKEACLSLITFAKENDTLFIICADSRTSHIMPLINIAKALSINLILLTRTSLKEAQGKADFIKSFKDDYEAFSFCRELSDILNGKKEEHTAAPLFPLGLSHSCFASQLDEQAFALFKENGISHIEISFGRYENTVSLDFKEYKRLADLYGITLWSFHLPFMPFTTLNPAHLDEAVRDFTVGYFKELIKEAKRDADINVFVLHGSGEPIHEDDRKLALKQLKKSVDELCAFAEENGVTVAIENLPRTCLGRDSRDMLEILAFNKNLKMCFDLNHTSGEKAEDIIRRFKNKIITLHVSDYMGDDECHLMPLEGVIDWAAVISALKEADYKGPFLYEISKGTKEDGAIWAKEAWHTRLFTRERFLNHKDVKENYEKLMKL